MKTLIFSLLWISFGISFVHAYSEAELRDITNNIEDYKKVADGTTEMENDDKIQYLGLALRKFNRNPRYIQADSDQSARNLIQEALLEIPGHATFYRDHILELRDPVNESTRYTLGPKYGLYLRERMFSLQTLKELPSPETIGVLGEMLADEWIPELIKEREDNDYSKTDFLCYRALETLIALPLEQRPAKTLANFESLRADLPAWRLWYAQIKAGTRTIRFKGDPNEYTLSGIVAKHADTPVRSQRRSGLAADATPSTSDDRSGIPWPVGIAFLVAAGLLVFVAVRIFRARAA